MDPQEWAKMKKAKKGNNLRARAIITRLKSLRKKRIKTPIKKTRWLVF